MTEAYTTELLPHEQQLVEERNQLSERVDKLQEFTNTAVFKSLDVTEQCLMYEQLNHMKIYLGILNRRLS